MSRRVIACCALLLLAACGGPESSGPSHDAAYYVAHPDEARARVEECRKAEAQAKKPHPDCATANEALRTLWNAPLERSQGKPR